MGKPRRNESERLLKMVVRVKPEPSTGKPYGPGVPAEHDKIISLPFWDIQGV